MSTNQYNAVTGDAGGTRMELPADGKGRAQGSEFLVVGSKTREADKQRGGIICICYFGKCIHSFIFLNICIYLLLPGTVLANEIDGLCRSSLTLAANCRLSWSQVTLGAKRPAKKLLPLPRGEMVKRREDPRDSWETVLHSAWDSESYFVFCRKMHPWSPEILILKSWSPWLSAQSRGHSLDAASSLPPAVLFWSINNHALHIPIRQEIVIPGKWTKMSQLPPYKQASSQ